MPVKLIADSGSTKCEWCLLANGKKKKIFTTGMSPYFLSAEQMVELLQKELVKKLKDVNIDEIYYYGTGLGNPANGVLLKKVLKKVFPEGNGAPMVAGLLLPKPKSCLNTGGPYPFWPIQIILPCIRIMNRK